MPLNNFPIDVVGITIEADPSALKMDQNLADLTDASDARTNLDVYDTGTTDTTFLALAGGTMTGAITFDSTGLQNINKGTFDNSTGGYNGISLTCAVGYELNWQGGHLGNWYSGAFQPIHLDSLLQSADATYDSEMGAWGFGVELTAFPSENAYIAHNEVRVENSAGGTSITSTGINFPDSTTQSTAAVPYTYDPKKAIANACASCMYVNNGYIYFDGGVALAVNSSSKFTGGGQYRLGWTNGGTYSTTFALSAWTNPNGDVVAQSSNGAYLNLANERLAYSDDTGSTWTYSDFTF